MNTHSRFLRSLETSPASAQWVGVRGSHQVQICKGHWEPGFCQRAGGTGAMVQPFPDIAVTTPLLVPQSQEWSTQQALLQVQKQSVKATDANSHPHKLSLPGSSTCSAVPVPGESEQGRASGEPEEGRGHPGWSGQTSREVALEGRRPESQDRPAVPAMGGAPASGLSHCAALSNCGRSSQDDVSKPPCPDAAGCCGRGFPAPGLPEALCHLPDARQMWAPERHSQTEPPWQQ